jgi:hypothetical protein
VARLCRRLDKAVNEKQRPGGRCKARRRRRRNTLRLGHNSLKLSSGECGRWSQRSVVPDHQAGRGRNEPGQRQNGRPEGCRRISFRPSPVGKSLYRADIKPRAGSTAPSVSGLLVVPRHIVGSIKSPVVLPDELNYTMQIGSCGLL